MSDELSQITALPPGLSVMADKESDGLAIAIRTTGDKVEVLSSNGRWLLLDPDDDQGAVMLFPISTVVAAPPGFRYHLDDLDANGAAEDVLAIEIDYTGTHDVASVSAYVPAWDQWMPITGPELRRAR